MLPDKCYWSNYSVLKQLVQILVLVHLLHLYPYQHLFLYSLIISSFLEIKILVCSLFLLWKQTCFWFYLDKFVWQDFQPKFRVFNDKFKVILNVRNWIRTIRQIKFIIPSGDRYFKLIVVERRFNVFPGVVLTIFSVHKDSFHF